MSTSTSATEEEPEAEVIDLEPTHHFDTAEPWASRASSSFGPDAVMAAAPAAQASIAGEIAPLLRSRLAATALLLAVASAILLIFHILHGTEHVPFSWFLLGARFVLPAMIAGLLLSPLSLSIRWLRGFEYALFGGLTLIVVVSEYTINLWLMQHQEFTAMVAFVKNGVIHMVVLMFLYGTFIPNKPKTVAWVVLSMALLPLLSLSFLTEHPEAAAAIEHLRSAEQTGSNALFLLIAAGMSIFGSVVLSGLRSELHVARKFGQYQLVRKLGEGGMGEVYLAEHSLLKRPCALKLIKPEAGTDPIAMARFEREVQSAARLATPQHDRNLRLRSHRRRDVLLCHGIPEGQELERAGSIARAASSRPRDFPHAPGLCGGLAEAHDQGWCTVT